jgi:DNA-directed RNA polymerase specialized sigma24 family protein
MKLDQSLGLLARYLMRGATIAELAEESDLDISTISRRMQEASRACGLRLRKPGRRKKTAD